MKRESIHSETHEKALKDSLAVARNQLSVEIADPDEKMLRIVLTLGDTDTKISSEGLKAWFLKSDRSKPSTYNANLAPGLIQQLMHLANIERISSSANFEVGPGPVGTGAYKTTIEKVSISITLEDTEIFIKTRKPENS